MSNELTTSVVFAFCGIGIMTALAPHIAPSIKSGSGTSQIETSSIRTDQTDELRRLREENRQLIDEQDKREKARRQADWDAETARIQEYNRRRAEQYRLE